MKKKAFITGISGQDGSYLAELLLEKDYDVYGIVRRNSVPENQSSRIDHISELITLDYGDLLDVSSLERLIRIIAPDEIYNIAAQSHVRVSMDIPQFTIQANALGLLNILEAYKNNCASARFYQASSSEMFGRSVDEDGYQRETTPMHPTSPYGCTKVFGFNMVVHYRHAYNLFASNGILFNHESPRRGSNFVTNKVVKSAVEIKKGLRKSLPLGNLDSFRDWGHSKDYVKAMHMILNHTEPDDFVCATGVTNSVGDMCKYVFDKLGMNYLDFVTQDERYLRSEDLKYLRGDSTKLRKTFGWKPEYTFETLMDEMIEHWLMFYNNKTK
jgi:GDPmannose 4,6-dehydratase